MDTKDIERKVQDGTIDRADRDRMIWELYAPPNCLSLREIGKVVGLSHVMVLRIINRYKNKYISPHVERYRAVISADCDLALEALRPRVEKGDVAAIQAMVKVHRELAKVHGVYAPTVQEVNYSAKWRELGFNFGGKTVDGEVVE